MGLAASRAAEMLGRRRATAAGRPDGRRPALAGRVVGRAEGPPPALRYEKGAPGSCHSLKAAPAIGRLNSREKLHLR
jgi:hypothetical protein